MLPQQLSQRRRRPQKWRRLQKTSTCPAERENASALEQRSAKGTERSSRRLDARGPFTFNARAVGVYSSGATESTSEAPTCVGLFGFKHRKAALTSEYSSALKGAVILVNYSHAGEEADDSDEDEN